MASQVEWIVDESKRIEIHQEPGMDKELERIKQVPTLFNIVCFISNICRVSESQT